MRRLAAIWLGLAILAAWPLTAAAQSGGSVPTAPLPHPPGQSPGQIPGGQIPGGQIPGQIPGAPPAQAEEPAAPQPPAISHECQTPGITISGEIELPFVTRAIKARKSIRIVTIGASNKGGKPSEEGYQHIIEAMLEKTIPGVDVQIINRGISGELARDAAERIKTEVALTRPDLVLWQLGTHDALMHVPVGEFKSTVAETVDWLRDHRVDVVMVGLHFLRKLVRDEHYQSVRAALRATAEQKKVLWIGRYEAMQVIEQARRASSGPSPNEFTMTESGYSCLSEYVARALTSGAFARPPRK